MWIAASLRTLVEVWLGHRSLTGAVDDGSLRLDGSRAEVGAFRDWFVLSHFAPAGGLQSAASAGA